MLLSDKYPFLTNYFETAINTKNSRFAQSIVFYGNDLNSQYILAREIARLLNCTGDKSDNCDCLNCKWIREETHPSVLTISRLDNKPDGDESKTVISVKQAELVRNSLIVGSDYYRVFIFCDRDEDGNIQGLNRLNFQEAVANSLLKSIEEPSEKVLFVFLTRDKDDLISTIISRSQCFFVPTKERETYNYELIEPVFKNYWDIPRAEAFNISEKAVSLIKEDVTPQNILEQLQNYMLFTLKSNPKNTFLINDIKSVEYSKKEFVKDIRPDIVFDELCLKLIR